MLREAQEELQTLRGDREEATIRSKALKSQLLQQEEQLEQQRAQLRRAERQLEEQRPGGGAALAAGGPHGGRPGHGGAPPGHGGAPRPAHRQIYDTEPDPGWRLRQHGLGVVGPRDDGSGQAQTEL
ncbi:uncharacterized protein LOC144953172 [Lampetra fluviatilis]